MKPDITSDNALIDDQCLEGSDLIAGFDELDLIEARIREAASLAAPLAAHLSRLLPEAGARAVIASLEEGAAVAVYGFLLTPDEASEMIRRLDPRWEGQGCERDGRELPGEAALDRNEEEERQKEAERKAKLLHQQKPLRSRRLGGFPRRRNS